MMMQENPIQKALNLPPAAQIGVVVPNLEEAIDFYKEKLSLGPFMRVPSIKKLMGDSEIFYKGESVECDLAVGFASLGTIELEIIEPLSGRSIHQDFLDSGHQGLHHLAFDVPDDLEQRVETYQKMGIQVLMNGKGTRSAFAYLDTERFGGFIIELLRRPPKEL